MKFSEWLKQFFDIKFFKFLLVGVINTVLGTGVMFLLYNVFDINYYVCTVCNYIVGGTTSYFLNKYFTFKNNRKSKRMVFYFIIFIVLSWAIAYPLLKYIIYSIFEHYPLTFVTLSEKAKGNIAMCFGVVVYTAINYICQRFIVFKEKKAQEKSEDQVE